MSLFRPSRRLFHLVSALLAALLALQLVPWEPAARLFPSLSPLLGFGGALATRTLHPALLLALPALILGVVRKRWFCYHLCPAGYCAEAVGKLNKGSVNRFAAWPRLGGWLALALLGGALLGYPLVLWLDPLSLFNAFCSGWMRPAEWTWPGIRTVLAAGLPPLATGFLVLLLVSLTRPHLWCLRLCPLGGFQDALHDGVLRLRALRAAEAAPADPRRRLFLGLAAGGAAALLARRASGGSAPVLRPPGAGPEARFKSLCARCGACLKACPQHVLAPDLGEAGLGGLLAPRIQYGNGYCHEQCRACTRACPTGALRPLSLEAKRSLALGTAVVNKNACLAWHDGLFCMACQEFCPYSAIRADEKNGINRPVVDPDLCRGCGACQNDCPARPKAITVKPTGQRVLKA